MNGSSSFVWIPYRAQFCFSFLHHEELSAKEKESPKVVEDAKKDSELTPVPQLNHSPNEFADSVLNQAGA